jgi:SAM-dependent methyltransferase
MNEKIFEPGFLAVFNHAKDISWWDSTPKFHRVNRNVVASCQALTATELLATLFKGKICFDFGGISSDYANGAFIRGFDLLHTSPRSIRGDILCLPFKNDSIDLIVTRHTLEHVEDMYLAFREIIRVLKHNAIIWGSMPDRRYFLHSTDPALGRGICAPSEKNAGEFLDVISSFKELEILLFNTADNNFDINFFLRINKYEKA